MKIDKTTPVGVLMTERATLQHRIRAASKQITEAFNRIDGFKARQQELDVAIERLGKPAVTVTTVEVN